MTTIGRRRIRNAGEADTTAVIADPVTVAEQPQAVTQTIVQPPPEVTEVITQPEPPAPELAVIATEEELRLFGGRPLSTSVTVRQAWLDANPRWLATGGGMAGEQTFEGLAADLAAWRQATTEDPGPEAQPPAGALAAPVASGPVTAANVAAGSAKGSARPPARKRTKGGAA